MTSPRTTNSLALVIAISIVASGVYLAVGCSESNEKTISDTIGLKGGLCKDGDFQYWPPKCVPDPVSTSTGN